MAKNGSLAVRNMKNREPVGWTGNLQLSLWLTVHPKAYAKKSLTDLVHVYDFSMYHTIFK